MTKVCADIATSTLTNGLRRADIKTEAEDDIDETTGTDSKIEFRELVDVTDEEAENEGWRTTRRKKAMLQKAMTIMDVAVLNKFIFLA